VRADARARTAIRRRRRAAASTLAAAT
jgi:hypothetical protein